MQLIIHQPEIGLINIAKDLQIKLSKNNSVENTKLSIVELYVIFDDTYYLT